MVNITFDPSKLERFKIMYQAAVARNADSFVFEGNAFSTAYAKYLIDYLEGRLNQ
jgi:hypothetical protein